MTKVRNFSYLTQQQQQQQQQHLVIYHSYVIGPTCGPCK